jgi:hypothetical protein
MAVTECNPITISFDIFFLILSMPVLSLGKKDLGPVS